MYEHEYLFIYEINWNYVKSYKVIVQPVSLQNQKHLTQSHHLPQKMCGAKR